MKIIFSLLSIAILSSIFLLSCNKEEASSRTYLEEGSISFSASGQYKGYPFNIEDSYSLFNDYGESMIYTYTTGDKIIEFRRYSPDFMDYMTIQLMIDSSDTYYSNWNEGVFFHITVLNSDHTYFTLHEVSPIAGCYNPPCPEITPPSEFSNIVYDPDSKRVSGDFSYTLDSLTIDGHFSVQLYEKVI
jgi:hypothetical protein